jgi:hypothetical protein
MNLLINYPEGMVSILGSNNAGVDFKYGENF